jgi:hypothetical protein
MNQHSYLTAISLLFLSTQGAAINSNGFESDEAELLHLTSKCTADAGAPRPHCFRHQIKRMTYLQNLVDDEKARLIKLDAKCNQRAGGHGKHNCFYNEVEKFGELKAKYPNVLQSTLQGAGVVPSTNAQDNVSGDRETGSGQSPNGTVAGASSSTVPAADTSKELTQQVSSDSLKGVQNEQKEHQANNFANSAAPEDHTVVKGNVMLPPGYRIHNYTPLDHLIMQATEAPAVTSNDQTKQ